MYGKTGTYLGCKISEAVDVEELPIPSLDFQTNSFLRCIFLSQQLYFYKHSNWLSDTQCFHYHMCASPIDRVVTVTLRLPAKYVLDRSLDIAEQMELLLGELCAGN